MEYSTASLLLTRGFSFPLPTPSRRREPNDLPANSPFDGPSNFSIGDILSTKAVASLEVKVELVFVINGPKRYQLEIDPRYL